MSLLIQCQMSSFIRVFLYKWLLRSKKWVKSKRRLEVSGIIFVGTLSDVLCVYVFMCVCVRVYMSVHVVDNG